MSIIYVDKKYLIEHEHAIKANIVMFIYYFHLETIGKYGDLDSLHKNEIFINSIICSKMIGMKHNNHSTFKECINKSQEFRDIEINITQDVPGELIIYFENFVNKTIKDLKKPFYIESIESPRYDLLFKFIIEQIKFMYKLHLKNTSNLEIPSDLQGYIIPVDFKIKVNSRLSDIFNAAIVFCICYEDDSGDHEMYRKVLLYSPVQRHAHQRRIEPLAIRESIIKDIESFIETYTATNKLDIDIFSKDTLFEKSSDILFNTLLLASNIIKPYLNNFIGANLSKAYKELFSNSQLRFNNSKMRSAFLVSLRKANMNYVMEYREKNIYPFLYDLIIMTFFYADFYSINQKYFHDIRYLAHNMAENKYKYNEKDSFENYYNEELKRIIALVPEEYKTINPSIMIVKHYSEILSCSYNAVRNVLNQLTHENTIIKPNLYNLPSSLKTKTIGIPYDYFRELSLYVL